MFWGELEDPVPRPFDRFADAEQFAFVCGGARHQLAVFRAMQRRTAGAEPQCPGPKGFLYQRAHRVDVGVGGGLVGCASVAHHEPAQRAVRDLRAHVEYSRLGCQCIEVFGEARPLPDDAFGHGAARDVFHALHQRDEPVMSVGCRRGEPHTAVAHHHGGHPMPTRRREVGVPTGLGVVVRVDVDEPRRHQQPVGIDRLVGRRARACGFHCRDEPLVDHHIGMASGGATPSTSRPLRMTRSCMAAVSHGCPGVQPRAAMWWCSKPFDDTAESC